MLKKNSIRLAKVWMDDYAKYYFQRIGNEFVSYSWLFVLSSWGVYTEEILVISSKWATLEHL